MSHKTWSPSKENLLLQHLSKLERSPSTEDHKKYGSQCSINLEDNLIDLPTEPKRRRIMAEDTPSSIGSQVSSQMSSRSHSPTLSEFLDDSLVSTPSASPSGTLKEHFRRKYRKDELWAAIETNYKYLMDKGIIEACQVSQIFNNIIINIEGWKRKRSKCFFTYIYLDHFRSHPWKFIIICFLLILYASEWICFVGF